MKTSISPGLTIHSALCRAVFCLCLAAGLGLGLMACDKATPPAPQPTAAAMPPPKVKIARALQQTVTEWDEFTGRIEAVNTIELRARVNGYLDKVLFAAGARVKKGDLLFVIDPKPLKAQLKYAAAELAQAQSRLKLAKTELNRAENLIQAKAISVEEYEARVKSGRETVAAVDAARAQVETARLNLEYTRIYAPIDGQISREWVTAGNLVNGNGTEATRLATLVATDSVYMYVDVDEQTLLKHRRQTTQGLLGAEVELALADEQGFPHSGRIDYIEPSANPATGTVTVRGVFANSDGLLSPGFFARLRIRSSQAYPALLLPDRAITANQSEHFVWAVDAQQQVVHRRVVLGAKIGGMRVIREGLQADDWVVIEGVQKLQPAVAVDAENITLTSTSE